MAITLNGTTGISSPGGDTSTSLATTNLSYTGTLTGGTGVIAIGTNQIYKDASGNVGIGTASPAALLHLSSGSGTKAIWGTTRNFTVNRNWQVSVDEYSEGQFAITPSTTLGGTTFTTPAIRLDSSGNFLVGATSTIASSRCVIKKDNDTQLTLDANNSGSGVFTTLSFANQGTVKTQVYWSSTSSNFTVQNGTGGVYVATNGTSWTSASDERLKTDLKPILNAAEKVASLRAVTGRFKTDEETVSRSFLIAQDVQAVLPEAVDASDPDKLGVQYTDTIPLLVAAIKELTTRLEALEAQ